MERKDREEGLFHRCAVRIPRRGRLGRTASSALRAPSPEGKATRGRLRGEGLICPSGTFPRGEGYEGKASTALLAPSQEGKVLGGGRTGGLPHQCALLLAMTAFFMAMTAWMKVRRAGKVGFDSGTYEERDGV